MQLWQRLANLYRRHGLWVSVQKSVTRHGLQGAAEIRTAMDRVSNTPPEKVQEAVEIAKDVLKDHEGMHPDFPPRVFFNEFNSTSLNLFVIYWYHPADYWQYMAFTEKVNMELLRRFNEAGIEFALPTQTLYLAGDPARPLNIGGLEGLPG